MELLISVVENRLLKDKEKYDKISHSKEFDNDVRKKAISKNGFVYLCKNCYIEETSIKLKKQSRSLFGAFFANLDINDTKSLLCITNRLGKMLIGDTKAKLAERLEIELKKAAVKIKKPNIFIH